MSDSIKAFEDWAKTKGKFKPLDFLIACDGRYSGDQLQSSFNGWQASRQALEGDEQVSVPEGYALVPKMMTLDFKAMERLLCMTGEDFMEDEFPECILWVGETIDDDGKVDTYGLNIACSECMEEGSVSVIEFANPVVTGAGDGASVPDRRGAGQAEGDA